MSANLGPDYVAGHEGAAVVRRTESLARFLAEARVRPQNVQEDRRIDRGRHRALAEARRARLAAAAGLDPRISSRRASTDLASFSRPKSWSTGCRPGVPFRRRTPPSRNSNRTGVPGGSPSFWRTLAGRVTWPFEDTVLFMLKKVKRSTIYVKHKFAWAPSVPLAGRCNPLASGLPPPSELTIGLRGRPVLDGGLV